MNELPGGKEMASDEIHKWARHRYGYFAIYRYMATDIEIRSHR